MNDNLSYILVSGGSGGVGSALCRMLPAKGLKPIVGYRSHPERAHAIAKECEGVAVELDLESDDSIEKTLAQLSNILGSEGKLAGVVLAASPPPELLPFAKLSAHILSHQFRVNTVGPQLLLAGLIKNFFRKEKSGTIVGILTEAMGSELRPPATSMGAYIIAKTAMKGMLAVCATEYPWLKVRSLSPGFTETEMLNVFDVRLLEMMRVKNKFSTAEEVATRILEEISR